MSGMYSGTSTWYCTLQYGRPFCRLQFQIGGQIQSFSTWVYTCFLRMESHQESRITNRVLRRTYDISYNTGAHTTSVLLTAKPDPWPCSGLVLVSSLGTRSHLSHPSQRLFSKHLILRNGGLYSTGVPDENRIGIVS